MPSLDLTRAARIAHMGREIAGASHLGAGRWAAGPVIPPVAARAPFGATTRSVHSGHSLTDAYIYGHGYPGDLLLLRNSLFDPDDWGSTYISRATIPGSSMSWRWNVESHDARDGVGNYDSLMITEGGPPPHLSDPYLAESTDYFCRFVANMIEHGAGDEVIIWTIWPALNGPGTYPESPIPSGPWAGMTFRTGLDAYWDSFKYMADYATWKMHQEYPSLPSNWRVWLIPGDRWMAQVYDDIQTGDHPGASDIQDLFSDDIHPNDNASYGLGCFVMSCLWQIDLREQTGVYVPPGMSNAVRDYYWRIAWELANRFETIGMGGTERGQTVWDPATDPDPLPDWALIYPDDGPTAPMRPSPPVVTLISHAGATASWTAPADGGSAITGYSLEWREVGGEITAITPATSPQAITGLDALKDYEVRVTATNAIGSSPASNWTGFTTASGEVPDGPDPVVEITPSAVAGVTFAAALPDAVGGFRTITASSSEYPHIATLPSALTGAVYTVAAVRWLGGSAAPELIALKNGTLPWSSPSHTMSANGYVNQFSTTAESGGWSGVDLGARTDGWAVIETWMNGTALGGCINGGADASTTVGSGAWSFSHLLLGGGMNGTFDLAAARVFDAIPDDRAAQRAWAAGGIPG